MNSVEKMTTLSSSIAETLMGDSSKMIDSLLLQVSELTMATINDRSFVSKLAESVIDMAYPAGMVAYLSGSSAATITSLLAAIGGPFGMVGGLAVVGFAGWAWSKVSAVILKNPNTEKNLMVVKDSLRAGLEALKKLVTRAEALNRMIAKREFDGYKLLGINYELLEMRQSEVNAMALKNPTKYVGMHKYRKRMEQLFFLSLKDSNESLLRQYLLSDEQLEELYGEEIFNRAKGKFPGYRKVSYDTKRFLRECSVLWIKHAL